MSVPTARYVSSGSPITPPSASFHNALVDLVNQGGHRGSLPIPGSQPVRILNNSGQYLDRFSILKVTETVKAPSVDGLAEFMNGCTLLVGDTPQVNSELFAITQQEIPAGGVGTCLVNDGISPCLVAMYHSGDQYAYADDSTQHLRSGNYGPWRILFAEPVSESGSTAYEEESSSGESIEIYWAIVAYVGQQQMGLVIEDSGAASSEGYSPGVVLHWTPDGIENREECWLVRL